MTTTCGHCDSFDTIVKGYNDSHNAITIALFYKLYATPTAFVPSTTALPMS